MKSELIRFFKRGLRQGSWPVLQRYAVAGRVYDLPPAESPRRSKFAAHLLLCERDAVMAHWCIRSFLLHAKEPFAIYFHDDGSCSAETLSQLRRSFPDSFVVSRAEAAHTVLPQIKERPELVQWREAEYIAIKCLDFYLIGDSEWVIILDPDVLFFNNPSDLFVNSLAALWMQDCFYSLYIDPGEARQKFGVTPLQINAGLGRMPRDSVDQSLLEEVLRFKADAKIQSRARERGLPKYEDQTYHALLSERQAEARLLPPAYQIATEAGLQGVSAKHYTTPARFWLYEEGIPRLARQLGIDLPLWLRERG